MRKNLIRLTVLLASLMTAFAACSIKEDPWKAEEALPDGIYLRFFCDEMRLTKAVKDTAGVSALNENRLASVEYFLYAEGRTGQDAVYSDYLTNVDPTKWNTIPLTEVFVNSILCPNSAKTFRVYAIANHPRLVAAVEEGESKDLSGTSVPELEALTQDIETTVVTEAGQDPKTVISPVQSKFLMATDGAFQVTGVQKRQSTVASADVKLKRNAAKISIYVQVASSTTIDNTVTITSGQTTITDVRHEVWTPDTDNMEVYLVNGAFTGQVVGLPYSGSEPFTYQSFSLDKTKGVARDYIKYVLKTDSEGHPLDADDNIIDPEDEDAPDLIYNPVQATGTFYPSEQPFYTYPVSWEYGSAEEPYIKLMIPWYREPGVSDLGTTYGQAQKSYYYRVYCPGTPIDGTHAQFLRNHWYEIFLNVSILGSETDGGSLLIPGSYYVVDWQERSTGASQGGSGEQSEVNDSDKEAEIKGARYLFVNKEEYYLYNVNTLSIPYITSDPCEIVGFSGKKYIFSGTTKTTSTISDKAEWDVTLATLTNTDGAHVSFAHTLNNDTSGSDYDVSEYEFTFTIRQTSNTAYAKTITIHQYPAIMIDMEANNSDTHYGYTYVNNGSTSPTNYGSIGTNGTSSGNNTNFNMFIVETTVLPVDSEYLLGDPRVTVIDNLNSTSWPSGKSSDVGSWSSNTANIQSSSNRRLTYYYPVNNSTSANNIIAPRFRIASSHGATGAVTYANAFRRCASYQEKGYPAGRWRLPTVAEVSYIAKLNTDGKIDRLFGGGSSSTDYWCNSGYITVYLSNTAPVAHTSTSGNKYVRCVYDEWYWNGAKYNGNDVSTVTPLNTFKWGDMQRTSNN